MNSTCLLAIFVENDKWVLGNPAITILSTPLMAGKEIRRTIWCFLKATWLASHQFSRPESLLTFPERTFTDSRRTKSSKLKVKASEYAVRGLLRFTEVDLQKARDLLKEIPIA